MGQKQAKVPSLVERYVPVMGEPARRAEILRRCGSGAAAIAFGTRKTKLAPAGILRLQLKTLNTTRKATPSICQKQIFEQQSVLLSMLDLRSSATMASTILPLGIGPK